MPTPAELKKWMVDRVLAIGEINPQVKAQSTALIGSLQAGAVDAKGKLVEKAKMELDDTADDAKATKDVHKKSAFIAGLEREAKRQSGSTANPAPMRLVGIAEKSTLGSANADKVAFYGMLKKLLDEFEQSENTYKKTSKKYREKPGQDVFKQKLEEFKTGQKIQDKDKPYFVTMMIAAILKDAHKMISKDASMKEDYQQFLLANPTALAVWQRANGMNINESYIKLIVDRDQSSKLEKPVSIQSNGSQATGASPTKLFDHSSDRTPSPKSSTSSKSDEPDAHKKLGDPTSLSSVAPPVPPRRK